MAAVVFLIAIYFFGFWPVLTAIVGLVLGYVVIVAVLTGIFLLIVRIISGI